ncbi:hypothetical protein HMPREF1870_00647 [Bacteroidales bacterium KA00344]|nr:hypothetical protein HMPREF1870_00647 [Bacteroidales bacterium KA00344]
MSKYVRAKMALLSFLVACVASPMWAQQPAFETTDPDTTINIVAFFCNHDTTTYTYESRKWKVNAGDTTEVHRLTEKFQLVVTDSTPDGYKLVYIPLSFEYNDTAKSTDKLMYEALWNLTRNLRPEFLMDEMGQLTHLTNWREIRDAMKKGNKMMLDSLYAKSPELDSVMPRQRMESVLALKFINEAGVMDAYEEVKTLFDLHGRQVKIGTTEVDDSTSFPSHTKLWASYEAVEDPDEDYEGDYAIQSNTVTTLSGEEAAALIGNVFNVLATGEVAGKLQQLMVDSLKTQMTVTNLEDYHYFFNGWPKLMRKQKIIEIKDHKNVDESSIEWADYIWGTYGGEAEEPKNSF